MALGTRKEIELFDLQFNSLGVFIADVTELSMHQVNELASVIDARSSLALVIRLKYSQSDLRQGFIKVKGYKKLFSIKQNTKVYRSNTFYCVESTRKAEDV